MRTREDVRAEQEALRAQVLAQLPIDVLRQMCVEDPGVFFSVCMGETFSNPSAEFHQFLIGVATSKQMTAKRECAVGPRGWGKSTTITEGGPVCITACNDYIPEKQRYKFILIVSETATQAQARLATIKDNFETNEELARIFPLCAGKGPVWSKEMVVTRNDVCIATAGISTSIRGIRYKNRRPDLIIIDDPDSLDTASSPTESQKIEDKFTRDVMKCGHKNTDILVAATIITKKCLAYKLLNSAEYAAWNGRVFKALESFPTRMDLWDKFGEILKNRDDEHRATHARAFYMKHRAEMDEGAVSNWPEVYPVYDLMCEYYTDGRKSFLAEKQNEIIETDVAHFSPERYKYYDEGTKADIVFNGNPIIYAYIDPAGGRAGKQSAYSSRGPDRFAMVLIAKVSNNRFMLIDHVSGQYQQSVQFEKIFQMLRKYRVYRLSVESNAGQGFYISALSTFLRARFADKEQMSGSATRTLIVPRPVHNSTAKEARISMLEPHLDNWTLELPHDMAQAHRNMYDELESWPMSDFDDCLDALSGCFFSAYRTFSPTYVVHA